MVSKVNLFGSFEAEAEHGTGDADGDGDAFPADRVRNPEGRSQGASRIYESDDGLSAGAVREVCRLYARQILYGGQGCEEGYCQSH